MRSSKLGFLLSALMLSACVFLPARSFASQALGFDGASDLVREPLGTTSPSNLDVSTFTVEAWVFPTQVKNMAVVSDSAYALQVIFDPVAANGGLGVNFTLYKPGGNHSVSEFREIRLNNWNHLAASYNAASNECILSINGKPQSSASCVDGSLFLDYDGLFALGTIDGGGASGVRPPTSSSLFVGRLFGVRVSNSVRYTADFVPTCPVNDSATLGAWLLNDPAGATSFAGLGSSHRTLSALDGAATVSSSRPCVRFDKRDVNYDGKSDVVLRNTNGTNYVWHLDATNIVGQLVAIPSHGYLPGLDANWTIVATGDFNGDGKSDALLRHTDGTIYVWHLDGASISGQVLSILSHGYLPNLEPGWTIAGVGDFNGDGKSDLVLRHTNGTNYIWHLDGASIVAGWLTIKSQGYLPPLDANWTIEGVGDFNGDGNSDLLLRHSGGTNYIWHLDGSSIAGSVITISSHGYLPGLDSSWSFAGVGDFNGDGKSDVLLRHSGGTNYVWHLDGSNIAGGVISFVTHGYLPTLNSNWSIAAVADFNGDGKSDVQLRNTNSTHYVWLIDGATIVDGSLSIPGQGYLPSLDSSWTVVRK